MGRHAALLVAATALLLGATASAANRGIPHLAGDKDTTSLTGTADTDTFVIGLPRGAALTATVKAGKGSSLLPALALLRPDGSAVAPEEMTAAKYKPGKSTAKVANFPVDETGTWAIRVSEFAASQGGTYTLTTKVKYPKPIKVKGAILPAGSHLEIEVPLSNAVKLGLTMKRKSGGTGFAAGTLRQGSGAPVAFPADLFTITEKAIVVKPVEVTTPSFSDHVLRIPGPGSGVDAVVDFVVKTTWPRRKGVARTVSSDEPAITNATPVEGNLGTTITVTGMRFASGATLEIGNKPATGVVRNPAGTQISGLAPAGGGLVDVAVTNPDGQEARLPAKFLYVIPPSVQSIDVDFGPSTGGTAVVITGVGFRAGATVLFGGKPIFGAVTVQDSSHIALTTESHASGTYLVTVKDPSGVSGPSATTFTFDRRLVRRGEVLTANLGELKATAAILGDIDSDLPFDDDLVVASPDPQPDGDGGYLPSIKILRCNNFMGFASVTAASFPRPYFVNVSAFEAAANLDLVPSLDDYGIAHALAMGDLDGDGDKDLVLGFDGRFVGTNYLVLGNPNYPETSTYRFIPSFDYWPDQQYYHLQYPGTRVFLNNGNNAFNNISLRFNTTYGYLDMAMPVLSQGIINGENFQASALALGDLDNDADLDLVLGSRFPVFGTRIEFSGGSYSTTHFVSPSLRLLTNFGDGRFDFQSPLFVSGWSPPSNSDGEWLQSVALAVADVDANGFRDVVAVTDVAPKTAAGAPIYATRLLKSAGQGFVNSPEALPAPTSVDDGRATCVVVADATGDGKPDILTCTPQPLIHLDLESGQTTVKASTRLLRNNGNGTFSDVSATAFPLPSAGEQWRAHSLALGDVNGDGNPDIVVTLDETTPDGSGGWRSSTRVLLGNGSGVFFAAPAELLPPVDLDAPGFAQPSFLQGRHVMMGDLDGDADQDIVLASENPASGIPDAASRSPGGDVIENR